jgi:hypothetical protein
MLLSNLVYPQEIFFGSTEPVKPASSKNGIVSLHNVLSPQRQVLENFIQGRYADCYHADVSHFLPLLLAAQAGDSVSGVLGLSPGNRGRFFVENYVEESIEQLITTRTGSFTARARIIETGNLAASRGGSQLLFILLTELLYRSGYRWIIFTATIQVNALLQRLGFAPEVVCEASPEKLVNKGKDWGSYYENNPYVLTGDVEQAHSTLERNPFAQKVLQDHAEVIQLLTAQLQAEGDIVADE